MENDPKKSGYFISDGKANVGKIAAMVVVSFLMAAAISYFIVGYQDRRDGEVAALRKEASQMLLKAGDAPLADQPALYDLVIERFENSPHPDLREQALTALLRKAGSLRGSEEAGPPLDQALTLLNKKEKPGQVAWARNEKSLLIKDSKERIALLDTVINDFGAERSGEVDAEVVRAMAYKARELEKDEADPAAAIAQYEQVLSTYGDSKDLSVRRWLVNSMVRRAGILPDAAEKRQALAEAVAAYGEVDNDYIRDQIGWALQQLVRLADSNAEKERLYDEMLNRFRNAGDQKLLRYYFSALSGKARLLTNSDAKQALYDEELALAGDAVSDAIAVKILVGKAEAVADHDERKELNDAIVARFKDSKDGVVQQAVAAIMRDRLRGLDSRSERIQYAEEMIALFADSQDQEVRRLLGSAMLDRARLLREPSEKLTAYDEILDRYATAKEQGALNYAWEAAADKARLLGDNGAKIALYDRILADTSNTYWTKAALDKAKLIGDNAEKMRIYDLVIERARASNNPDINLVGDSFLAKAKLLTSKEEKIALYDEMAELARKDAARGRRGGMFSEQLASALGAKGDVLRDYREFDEYYDEFVARETDVSARARLARNKNLFIGDVAEKIRRLDALLADATMDAEERSTVLKWKIAALDEEQVALYDQLAALPETGWKGQMDKAFAFRGKIRLTANREEKLRLFDKMVEEGPFSGMITAFEWMLLEKADIYESYADKHRVYDELLSSFERSKLRNPRLYYQVLLAKAKMSPPEQAAELYDKVIDEAWDIAESGVASLYDEAVAEREKLHKKE